MNSRVRRALRAALVLFVFSQFLISPSRGELKAAGFMGLNLYMSLDEARAAMAAIFGPGWEKKAQSDTMQSYAEKARDTQAHRSISPTASGSLVRYIRVQDFNDRTRPRVTLYFEEDYPRAPGKVIVVGIRFFFPTGDTEADQAANLESLKAKFGQPNCGNDLTSSFRVWSRDPNFNCSSVAVMFADPRSPQIYAPAQHPGKLVFPLIYQARQARKDSWLELADYPAFNLREAAMQADLNKLSTAPKIRY